MIDDTTLDGPAPLIGGRFRALRALGTGGQGQVLLAADTIRADEPVALKLVRPLTEQARQCVMAATTMDAMEACEEICNAVPDAPAPT